MAKNIFSKSKSVSILILKWKIIAFAFLLISIIISSGCNRDENQRRVFFSETSWNITIPKEFTLMKGEEVNKMLLDTKERVKQYFSIDDDIDLKPLFVYTTDKDDIFFAYFMECDSLTKYDFNDGNVILNDLSYDYMVDLLQTEKVYTTPSIENIDNLEFNTLTIKMILDGLTITSKQYRRLFKTGVLFVNLMYKDEKQAQDLIKIWQNSKFKGGS